MKKETFLTQEIGEGEVKKKFDFALDEEGSLYVNNKKVVTNEKLKLEGSGLCFLAIGSISALAQAIISALQYWNS